MKNLLKISALILTVVCAEAGAAKERAIAAADAAPRRCFMWVSSQVFAAGKPCLFPDGTPPPEFEKVVRGR